MRPWKIISQETLVRSRFLRVDKEVCELPDGKRIPDFYTLWQPDWVLIFAKTGEGKWLMTRQYRHGSGKVSLEFPAGILNAGETPLEAAVRELREECGYGGGAWTFFREFPVNPDRHRGRYFVVIAENVERVGSVSFDETEWIETEFFSAEEILESLRSGELNHPLQIAPFLLYQAMPGSCLQVL
jgi:8-oxo-dGTP pyrophosphatase MutT (NUDIX family)